MNLTNYREASAERQNYPHISHCPQEVPKFTFLLTWVVVLGPRDFQHSLFKTVGPDSYPVQTHMALRVVFMEGPTEVRVSETAEQAAGPGSQQSPPGDLELSPTLFLYCICICFFFLLIIVASSLSMFEIHSICGPCI